MAAVKIESGLWTTIWRAKKASTTFTAGSWVALDDGYVTPGDSSTGAADEPILGVYEGPSIVSTTTGAFLYSNTALVPVQVPIGPALVRATTTATLAATHEGCSFDLTDATHVNPGSTTYGCVTLVKFVSTTEGIYAISKSIYANVA
jgi:hypothetical protein